jgi:hypothetical protein
MLLRDYLSGSTSRMQAKISSTSTDFVVTPGVKTSQMQVLLHVMVKRHSKTTEAVVQCEFMGEGCQEPRSPT